MALNATGANAWQTDCDDNCLAIEVDVLAI